MSKYCTIVLIVCLVVQSPLVGSASLPTPPRQESVESPTSSLYRVPVTPPNSLVRSGLLVESEDDSYDDDYDADLDEYFDDEKASSSLSSFEDEFDGDEMAEWDYAVEVFYEKMAAMNGGAVGGDVILKAASLIDRVKNDPIAGRIEVAVKAGSLIDRVKNFATDRNADLTKSPAVVGDYQNVRAGSLIELMKREHEEMVRIGQRLFELDATEYESDFDDVFHEKDELIFKFDDPMLR